MLTRFTPEHIPVRALLEIKIEIKIKIDAQNSVLYFRRATHFRLCILETQVMGISVRLFHSIVHTFVMILNIKGYHNCMIGSKVTVIHSFKMYDS